MTSFREKLAEEWPTGSLFVLTFYIVTLVAFMPALDRNTLFRTIAQAIVITGLIGIALAYHYRVDLAKQNEIDKLKAENDALKIRIRINLIGQEA